MTRQLASAVWGIRGGVLLAALGSSLGCTAYGTFKDLPVDCSVTGAYQFLSVDNFEGEMQAGFFTSTDPTPGASVVLNLGTPPDGPRCGSMTALEILSSGNNDWGSLIGYNNFGPRDASAYEGVSFWATSAGNTNGTITVLFDDPNTHNGNDDMKPTPPTANCIPIPMPVTGMGSPSIITDPATGAPLSSGTTTAPPPPYACGNSYVMSMIVRGGWHLYTIPFREFRQTAMPNRVPNASLTTVGSTPGTALITSRLMTFTLRFPKGIPTDLWIDDIAFYRHAGWTPPTGDAGTDAP